MNKIQSEMEYEDSIIETLVNDNGFINRSFDKYNPRLAMDTELLFKFLYDTQSETMEELRKIYKDKLEETIVNFINSSILQKDGSLIKTLKKGIEIHNHELNFMYAKAATSFNPEINKKYEQNILSVMKEVRISDKERIDIVIFLNGFAIFAIELKCEFAGQTYRNGIEQYRLHRDPKNRLFLFKKGVLCSFVMDLNEVYMTTKLDGPSTFFMPFNKGSGEGINTGAGNPIIKGKYSVSYMWEDIFTKDTIIDLISHFIFIETKKDINNDTGEVKIKESLIFPRYHQLDCIRKLLADVYENKTSRNYLIEHSAGSGKTNTIAWLAHRLSTFHDANDVQIYDNIIIVTDRVVVDRQLQAAVMGIDHTAGRIKVMDDKCNSSTLKKTLEGDTKIIATTIQKFPYIVDSVSNLKNKKFAVIIDEAHSSTTGKDMAAVMNSLSSGENKMFDVEIDTQDILDESIAQSGKRDNMSIFAFTATPKATTLQLFGTLNEKGQFQAFHLYSMKQAIEEGFIVDVLQNYTTIKTYYELNKQIEDDPIYKTRPARKQISYLIAVNPENIRQRVEIIVDHFVDNVAVELGGTAKAMVVTSSREEAIRFYQECQKYIEEKEYKGVKSLIAFSGKFRDVATGEEYSESSINKFPESVTATKFDTNEYRIMIVADKYQTGYDQDKLAAMYVLKKLRGVNAVQTLSRLNRTCPPYDDKHVFVLDFVNDYEDIEKAFEPYYTGTFLVNTVNKENIYALDERVNGLYIFEPDLVDRFNELLLKPEIDPSEKKEMEFILQRTKLNFVKDRSADEQRNTLKILRRFVRFYEFLRQATRLEDIELQKKYNLVSYFISYTNIDGGGQGFDLSDKVIATNFRQKKEKTVLKPKIKPNPEVKLPMADQIQLNNDDEKKLSEILRQMNLENGTDFKPEYVTGIMSELRMAMKNDEDLKKSAQNNTIEEFRHPYMDMAEEKLVEVRDGHAEFIDKVLSSGTLMRDLLEIYLNEMYKGLRTNDDKNKKK